MSVEYRKTGYVSHSNSKCVVFTELEYPFLTFLSTESKLVETVESLLDPTNKTYLYVRFTGWTIADLRCALDVEIIKDHVVIPAAGDSAPSFTKSPSPNRNLTQPPIDLNEFVECTDDERSPSNAHIQKTVLPDDHPDQSVNECAEELESLAVGSVLNESISSERMLKAPDDYTENELRSSLHEWLITPRIANRDQYPFPCSGFISSLGCALGEFCVHTRKLGTIKRRDDHSFQNKAYAWFVVTGPGVYKAWEYTDTLPHSLKSIKYSKGDFKVKGYALLCYGGDRNDSESSWYAWNDEIGIMKCQTGAARNLKKKYCDWQPSLQMVLFDAVSIQGKNRWSISSISYIHYEVCSTNAFWPRQAYYVQDLKPLPREQQNMNNPEQGVVFWSKFIRSNVTVQIKRFHNPPLDDTFYDLVYGGIVVADFSEGYRKYIALCVAELNYWEDASEHKFTYVSTALGLNSWDTKTVPMDDSDPEVELDDNL